jgi:hypothetical protein
VAEKYAEGFDSSTPLHGWWVINSCHIVQVNGQEYVEHSYWHSSEVILPLNWTLQQRQGKLQLNSSIDAPEWKDSQDPRRAITVDHVSFNLKLKLKVYRHFEWAAVWNLRKSTHLSETLWPCSKFPDISQLFRLFNHPDSGGYAASKSLQYPIDSKWYYSSGTTNLLSRRLRHSFENDK